MPTVTQFGLIQLAQPSSIADLEGNKDYVKAIQTIRAQPGCIRTGWGIPEGKPQQLVWLHEWDDLASADKFHDNAEAFAPVRAALGGLIDKSHQEPLFFRHIALSPSPFDLAGKDAPLQDYICLMIADDTSNEKMTSNAQVMRDVCHKMGKRQVSGISMDKSAQRVYFATNVFADWEEGDTFAKSPEHQKAMKEVPPGGVARFVGAGHFYPVWQ